MKITDVMLFQLSGTIDGPAFPPGNRQAKAIDIYPEFNQPDQPSTSAGPRPIKGIYVEITTDEGELPSLVD